MNLYIICIVAILFFGGVVLFALWVYSYHKQKKEKGGEQNTAAVQLPAKSSKEKTEDEKEEISKKGEPKQVDFREFNSTLITPSDGISTEYERMNYAALVMEQLFAKEKLSFAQVKRITRLSVSETEKLVQWLKEQNAIQTKDVATNYYSLISKQRWYEQHYSYYERRALEEQN
ncbi:MAG: hypothetical protein ACK5JF_10280 [Oscillospiraceae bacterium]